MKICYHGLMVERTGFSWATSMRINSKTCFLMAYYLIWAFAVNTAWHYHPMLFKIQVWTLTLWRNSAILPPHSNIPLQTTPFPLFQWLSYCLSINLSQVLQQIPFSTLFYSSYQFAYFILGIMFSRCSTNEALYFILKRHFTSPKQ